MRSLNLDQLRTLVAIADLGTFAAAAQALHLAAPTVSLHISELETRLEAPLLLRGKRSTELTAAGQALVKRGRALLRDAEDAIAAVRRHAQGRAGRVRLGTATGVLVYLLPAVLDRLAAQYPEIEVEVQLLDSLEALARIEAGSLDIGLITLPAVPRADIVVTPWRSNPMMAFLPPGWEVPDRVDPAWLAGRPLVFNDNQTQMYRMTMAWFGAAGHSPVPRIELNYTEAMKSLVAAGYGAALLPLEQAQSPHKLALHERIQLRPLNPPLQRELGIVHRRAELLPPGARAVLEVLETQRDGQAPPAQPGR
jgi:DNA-binding transcriptional LysR family regulator